MVRLMVFFLSLFSLTVAAVRPQSGPTTQPEVRSTIIAMERHALDRSDKGDVEGFLEISDPEVTYFDPAIEQPIHGRDALRAYYAKSASSEQSSGEMSNVQVQVSGSVAVLTFNYTSKTAGRVIRWNATEVYWHGINGWRIIHRPTDDAASRGSKPATPADAPAVEPQGTQRRPGKSMLVSCVDNRKPLRRRY